MKDQATKLREMIQQRSRIIKPLSSLPSSHEMHMNSESEKKHKQARVICVTSGKGGVGKTNFTINLGIALSKNNQRVVIVDADLGLANIDIVLGTVPKYTLLDVVRKDKDIVDVMIEGPSGIKIISGGSGVVDLIDMSQENINRLIESFEKINEFADIILIDTGAGLSKSVLSFVLAAPEAIVVTTPEPTAITDAYALIKTIALKGRKNDIKVIINRVENTNEGRIAFEKLQNASEKFLNAKIEKLGYISEDVNVSKSVKIQNPFVLQFPNSVVSKNIEMIALKLMDNFADSREAQTTKSFLSKVIDLFR